ncbi:MAG: hypothetical protein NZ534_05435, partial [Bacteroidia bacterium]|nr:hypothetical protein [Bacteroidia bacterium]
IVDAFSNPMETIRTIGEAIKQNLLNRFRAVGMLMEAISEGSFSKAKDAALQLATGIEDVAGKASAMVDKVAAFGKKMVDTYNEASSAQRELLELQQVAKQEAEKAAIALLGRAEVEMKTAENATKSYEERFAALARAQELTQKGFDVEIAAMQKELALTQKLNSFTDTSAEALQAQYELEKALAAKIAERDNALADLAKTYDELRAEQAAAEEAARQAEAARVESIENAAAAAVAKAKEIRDALSLAAEADPFAQKIEEVKKAAEAEIQSLADSIKQIETKTVEEVEKLAKAQAEAVAAIREREAAQLAEIEKERAAKAAEEAAKARVDAIEKWLSVEQAELEQALADGVVDRRQYELAQLKLAERSIRERLQLVEKGSKEEADLLKEAAATKIQIAEKEAEERKAITEAIQKKATETLQEGLSIASEILNLAVEQNISKYEQERDARIAALDEQLQKGLITQEQYDVSRQRLEEKTNKKIAEEKKKAAEAQKAFAIANAIVTTATAVLQAYLSGLTIPGPQAPILAAIFAGIAAAFGAAQIATIAATPIPEFAEGVIGLQVGAGDKSDDVPAFLSRGESVMTASETRRYLPALKAIRAGLDPAVLNAAAYRAVAAPFDYARIEAALAKIEKTLAKKESVAVNVDEEGFSVFVHSQNKRYEYLNKRYGLG